ncbi:ABC transporter substrate-binding protein [Natrononativus amylolyticus]|uniref:ABC transporter substrate-binding protein n=1 Tax=Natrononativus amylolyticus TaxID=2963434 RepID=UPI0020CD0CCC|nr:ABC transporter substrate-binding protein [Natrononativus amylolyticus]
MARDERADFTRRSILKLAGAATATAVVAGCTGNGNGDDDDDTGNGDADDTGTGNGDDDREVDEDAEVDEVVITQGSVTDTLDPIDHNDTPTWNILNQAYEPLIYRDRDGELIERIATSWERTDDMVVELEIRDDVTFHNGEEMTAEDVAFSVNRTNDPDQSQQAGVIGAIEEASAVDETTIELQLEATEPAIFRNLSAFGRVQQQEWVEERDDDELATEINGTGPYELEDFEEGSHVDYTRFDDYWGDEPRVVEARFNATADEGARVSGLEGGDSDIVTDVNPADISDVQDNEDLRIEGEPSIRNIFLVMPNDEAPFDSEEFRQAMNYAVNVEAIIESLLNGFGEPTSQPTLEGMFGHNPDVEPYGHDPDQAEELVEESGHTDEELTIVSPTGRYLGDTDIAAQAASDIDNLENVSASHDEWETQSLFDVTDTGDMSDSPDIFLIGWGNPTFDAGYALNPWFMSDQPFWHFEDDEIEGILDEATGEPDEDAREELLMEANQLANERAAWVFLHQQYSIYGVNDELAWDARQDEDIRLDEISAYAE